MTPKLRTPAPGRIRTLMMFTLILLLCVATATTAVATGGRTLKLLETPANEVTQVAPALDNQEVEFSQWQRLTAARTFPAWSTPRSGDGKEDGMGCEIGPPSPSVGADIPQSYFGAEPSTVNPAFIGRLQLLTAGELDELAGTITLPLYRGILTTTGENVWYILTDTTDEGNAKALGLNFAPKLNYAATGFGVRSAVLRNGGVLAFGRGRVDFAPERQVVPGDSAPFPPSVAAAGSVGNRPYSPLVKIRNAGGHIYNAPMIAYGVSAEDIHFPDGNPDYSLVHDKVIAIDTIEGTVTLALTPGFSFARPVLYLSTEASQPDVAALEGATFAPGLQDVDVGRDDSAFSAVERIFVMSNGPTGCENPQRQGLTSAIEDARSPFNVLGGIPTIATDYSPLWDVNLGEWTQDAIENGYRSRVTEEFQILGLVEGGFITGPGGMGFGSVGAIVNCPIVFRFL